MAKVWTEEEVRRLERQRELQDRARAANPTAGMSFNERTRYRWEQERKLDEDRFRASHGGMSRAEVAAAGPNGSGRQYAAIRRGFELQAAREHEMKTQAAELATRKEEARLKALGMEKQGLAAALARAKGELDVATLNAGSAEKQREHELEMLGRTQTFQGTQADAERRNRFDIADVQAEAQENTARIQARAQEARMYAENMMKQRLVDEESAMKFAEKRAQMISQLIGATKDKRTGRPRYTEEEAAKIIDERLEGQLPGTERRLDSWRK